MNNILKGVLALAFQVNLLNAQSVISGTVVTSENESAPFITVGLRNTNFVTVTSESGEFKIKGVKEGNYILFLKGIGYEELTDTIEIKGDLTIVKRIRTSNKELDEVVVSAGRINNDNGMAFSNVDNVTIKKLNMGMDAPYALSQLPGVVVNSDAGNGVGYTGLRIRGSDGTRINVTINGVPVNDAESQGTFFVDMPDLLSSVNNIQVQRGVGTSNNGAGAFGASVNFQTNQLNDNPYANFISTAGTFNTFRNTIAAGTGLMNEHFTLDARVSRISSDGYVDRASSDLRSYYISGGYYGQKSVLKFINFSGTERTYQAWNFVPEDSIKKGNRTYNEIGAFINSKGELEYYRNETDNYVQNNSQLHFIHKINSRLNFNLTGHYTKGKGYYEQLKQQQLLSDYGLPPVITQKGDTISSTDIVRRLWLDNEFAGALFNLNYVASPFLSITVGGGYNTYFGKHFGRLTWTGVSTLSEPDYQYYLNTANKNDGNLYIKFNYRPLSSVNLFLDLQSRKVDYRFLGFNDSLVEKMQDKSYIFFNPKAGISVDVSQALNVYASIAVANKEPNRNDFVQNTPAFRPSPENLVDIETGAKFISEKFQWGLNFYNMQYKNQLVVNGQVNYVGAAMRVNVKESYRRGVELEAAFRPVNMFSISGNVTFSQNKISRFSEFIDSSYATTTDYIQYEKRRDYINTDIALSPNIVSSLILTFVPVKNLELSFINKQVGKQFLDNTSNNARAIKPYNVSDLRFNYTLKTKLIPEIGFMLTVYNVFNKLYETNGYTYSYFYDGDLTTVNYLAPAAPLHFLGGVNIKF